MRRSRAVYLQRIFQRRSVTWQNTWWKRKNHEREEEVLFPRLEARDNTGPPGKMREDHDRFWPKKLRLKELSELLDESGLGKEEKDELLGLSAELIQELRDHIFKKNNILYPTFVDNIEDEEDWKEVREEFDEIGYCCFSPEEAEKGR